jgi:hypothetical protein
MGERGSMENALVFADNSTILGDGTPNDPLRSVAGFTSPVQAFRVPFTPSPTQDTNENTIVLLTFPVPFADTLYTLLITMEMDTANLPVFVPNHVYVAGDNLFDPVTDTLQVVTMGGTAGPVAPAFNPVELGTTATGPDTLVFTNAEVLSFEVFVQKKLAASAEYVLTTVFTLTLGIYTAVPFIANVLAIHD